MKQIVLLDKENVISLDNIDKDKIVIRLSLSILNHSDNLKNCSVLFKFGKTVDHKTAVFFRWVNFSLASWNYNDLKEIYESKKEAIKVSIEKGYRIYIFDGEKEFVKFMAEKCGIIEREERNEKPEQI
jgi:hypothetical protein